LATYTSASTFDQSWSNGFIEIWSMPTVLANMRKRNAKSKLIQNTQDNNAKTTQQAPETLTA
ncbi:MAG TPA: hypothetical protein VE177_02020, partial [Candidatus Binatus sp.]|nr:hypothetical protein [Candidatus Binatus sp.]